MRKGDVIRMKKIILVLAILFFAGFAFAEDCAFAVPRYGSVVCRPTGSEDPVNLIREDIGNKTVFKDSCISECHINTKDNAADIKLGCYPAYYLVWSIKIDGESQTRVENQQYFRGQEITIEAYCQGILDVQPVNQQSSVKAYQKKIQLEEAWAGTLEYVPIPGTEGCSFNEIAEKYKDTTDPGVFVDPEKGDAQDAKPSSIYTNISQFPTNWAINDSYVFVRDWDTDIANISFTYDKQKNIYWCGGLSGKRKIYSVKKVYSPLGTCYAIPQSIYLSNVECCTPVDCTHRGVGYTCNPDNWRCEETKPCNSDLDCQQTFASGLCGFKGTSKIIVSWICDLSKRWGDYAGTCTKSERNVQQCPQDCTSEEYYNEAEGTCKPLVVLIDCPYENCCKEGGDYKPKSCATGMECCAELGATLGKCKPSCAPPPTVPQPDGFTPLPPPDVLPTATDVLFPVIILVIIGGGAFAAYYFFYMQPKQQQPTIKQTPPITGPVCGKCNTPLKPGAKFCKGCGNKL